MNSIECTPEGRKGLLKSGGEAGMSALHTLFGNKTGLSHSDAAFWSR